MFQTDIKLVFDSVRYAGDKEAFRKKVLENEAYGRLRGNAFDVIRQYANLKEVDSVSVCDNEKGEENMCKAMLELIEEGREEGREETLLIVNKLTLLLLEQGRTEDLARAAKDKEYQQKLFDEFGL